MQAREERRGRGDQRDVERRAVTGDRARGARRRDPPAAARGSRGGRGRGRAGGESRAAARAAWRRRAGRARTRGRPRRARGRPASAPTPRSRRPRCRASGSRGAVPVANGVVVLGELAQPHDHRQRVDDQVVDREDQAVIVGAERARAACATAGRCRGRTAARSRLRRSATCAPRRSAAASSTAMLDRQLARDELARRASIARNIVRSASWRAAERGERCARATSRSSTPSIRYTRWR